MIFPRSFLAACGCVGVMLIASACGSDSNSTPTAPTCSFSVAQPTTTTFGPEGGTGSIAVTAASGCAWTAASGAAFVTISQGASGSGNGSVTFAVAVNTTGDRTATLTIAGTSITITQRAAGNAPAGTLATPTARSPIGGALVDPGTPTLVVNNAAATGAVGSVTYRFEVSDLPTFPVDAARTFTQDGVAQGSGTTSWVVTHNLGANVLWYWHARATNGTTTTAYSATETFSTGSPCALTLSATNVTATGSGGPGTISVTGASGCGWTAVSNSAFITITGGDSGSGNGTVSYTVAANSGAARTGTLTIAGQTVTISQAGSAGIAASFLMTDPGLSSSPTTECRITSGIATTCALQSTSFPLGTNGLVSFDWTAQWTDGNVITKTQTGASPAFSFVWTCGGPASTDDGTPRPLAVTLTVTDSLGNTATVSSGSGSQPPLFIRLFKC